MMKKWKRALAISLISACLVGGTAWADSQTSPEVEAVKEAFIGSQDISYQIGYFESENGKTDMLTEEHIQAYIDDFNTKMDQYYAESNVCRQTYKETNEKILCEIGKNRVCYVADAGVLDYTFRNVNISEDGQTATVKAVCQVWGNWVEQNENDKLEVTAPINQNTITATMVKEDGLWKLQNIDEMNVEFAGDAINELEEQREETVAISAYSDDQVKQMETIDEYVEQTCLTEYETFDEALAVAESLNPDEINPFKLLLSRIEN